MIDSAARETWRDLDAKLRPFIARRVSVAADVDDVLQEVFLRMHRGIEALREDERFGPWMYRVTRSAITDHLRVRQRHALSSEVPPDEGAESVDADDPELQAKLAACVAPFIASLAPVYRDALRLTELEGLNQAEAAALAGISVSGMKSRVQRARRQLREAFEQCCRIALDARGHVTECEPRGCGSGHTPGSRRCRAGAAE